MIALVAANNQQNQNNNNNSANHTGNNMASGNGTSSTTTPPPPNGGARCAHALSTFTNFVGGLLTLIGACLQQRRYSTYTSASTVFRTNYDLYFYTLRTSVRFGRSTDQALPDCIKSAYAAGMAMAIIGAAMALLIGLPLSYCAVKYKDSPLRFMRPFALIAAGTFALIAAIISGATTDCDGFDLSANYKLSVGFALLISGALILLVMSSSLSLLQALTCADVTPPVVTVTPMSVAGGQSPQMAFASSPQQHQQQQQAGGAPVYNFASQQQQQPHQYQQQQPVMGQPAPYNYGGGPGVHQNDPYAQQQQPMGYGNGQPSTNDPYAQQGGNMYGNTSNNDIYGGKSTY